MVKSVVPVCERGPFGEREASQPPDDDTEPERQESAQSPCSVVLRRSSESTEVTMAVGPSFILALGLVLGASAQYESHGRIPEPRVARPVTETVTRTDTVTHTFRVTTTSDIWVTESTFVELPVTVYTTERDFVPEVARTVTSVLRVTTTPVAIKTAEEFVNPSRTFVSVFTSFVTTTETVKFWQSIYHVSTDYQVTTLPVWTTQELVQHVITTTTHYVTNFVTSTQFYGH
ncbi:hypothetical protein C7M84_001263 [Penaeus vannamei]|uniref:Uncharacterized protein n=2 Tax=Penaeus vannamei TaxID=6689 RepID=A0A3R7QII0_PENVA|nr:hypothetical protein C7M84_001263 [Penaeus vannamei]